MEDNYIEELIQYATKAKLDLMSLVAVIQESIPDEAYEHITMLETKKIIDMLEEVIFILATQQTEAINQLITLATLALELKANNDKLLIMQN